MIFTEFKTKGMQVVFLSQHLSILKIPLPQVFMHMKTVKSIIIILFLVYLLMCVVYDEEPKKKMG